MTSIHNLVEKPCFSFALKTIIHLDKQENIQQDVHGFTSRTNPVGIIKNVILARKKKKILNADIVHVHFGSIVGLSACFVAGLNSKLIVSLKGSDINFDPDSGKIRNKIQKIASKLCILVASRIQCVSTEIAKKLPLKKQKHTYVFPDSVNEEIFKLMDTKEARSELSLSSSCESTFIAFNGKHNQKNKHRDRFEEIIIRLREQGIPIHPLPIEGQYTSSEVATVLSAADILLLLSDHEGSPNIVREALMVDCAVVSTDVGDVKGYSHSSKRCVVSDYELETFCKLIVEQIGLRRDGLNRAIALNEFSARVISAKWLSVYKDALV